MDGGISCLVKSSQGRFYNNIIAYIDSITGLAVPDVTFSRYFYLFRNGGLEAGIDTGLEVL